MNVLHKGKIITKGTGQDVSYLDQLCFSKEVYINFRKMKQYLRKTYNMSTIEYYNLVMFGDKKYVPLCPICNKPRRFNHKNSISKGYIDTCGDIRCINECLSNTQHDRFSKMSKDELSRQRKLSIHNMSDDTSKERTLKISAKLIEFNDNLSDEQIKQRNQRNRNNILKYINSLSKEERQKITKVRFNYAVRCKADYTRFINTGSETDECVLYVAKLKNGLKFGISSNIKVRSAISKFERYIILHESKRNDIALLEYKIKMKMHTYKEYLHSLKDIVHFIHSYNESK